MLPNWELKNNYLVTKLGTIKTWTLLSITYFLAMALTRALLFLMVGITLEGYHQRLQTHILDRKSL